MKSKTPRFHADRIWNGPFAVWQTGTTHIVFRSDSKDAAEAMAQALTEAAASIDPTDYPVWLNGLDIRKATAGRVDESGRNPVVHLYFPDQNKSYAFYGAGTLTLIRDTLPHLL